MQYCMLFHFAASVRVCSFVFLCVAGGCFEGGEPWRGEPGSLPKLKQVDSHYYAMHAMAAADHVGHECSIQYLLAAEVSMHAAYVIS